MLMPRGPKACPIAGPGLAVPAGTRILTVRTNDMFSQSPPSPCVFSAPDLAPANQRIDPAAILALSTFWRLSTSVKGAIDDLKVGCGLWVVGQRVLNPPCLLYTVVFRSRSSIILGACLEREYICKTPGNIFVRGSQMWVCNNMFRERQPDARYGLTESQNPEFKIQILNISSLLPVAQKFVFLPFFTRLTINNNLSL